MGKNWAVTIGVNQYDYLQPLQYAQRDAEAMRDYFLGEAGFETVYHFSADADTIPAGSGPPLNSKPTFGALERFLRVRFERKFLKSGDNLWFFFAGHGIRYENRDYLMPSDGDRDNVERTAISINYITEKLRECGADNVILLIDACRNERTRDGIGVGQEKQKGVVTIFSCSPHEVSYEIDELRQGSFTYALLEGLRIQGEGNCATVERLSHYVKRRASQLTRHYCNDKQTPYPVVEPASKYHLILLPQQATVRDAETLKMDAYKAEVDREWDIAKQLWVRVLAVSPADMDAVEAIERLATGQTNKARQTAKQKLSAANPRGNVLNNNFLGVQPRSQPLVSRRQVIQWGGVAVGIVGAGAIAQILSDPELKSDPEVTPTPEPEPISQPTPTSTEEPIQTSSSSEPTPFDFKVVTVNKIGEIIDRHEKKAKEFIEKISDSVNLEMVQIPSGEFTMGAPETEEGSRDNEHRQRLVKVPSFFMGKYPVTQAQWKAVTALPKVNRDLKPDPSHFTGDNRPVETVSWHDAVEFCDRLSQHTKRQYRFPSEAEWEYACRAGTTTPFHFGETITTDLANYRGTDHKEYQLSGSYGQGPKGISLEKTTPVGSFDVANAFGLYDMHGNVWEWCLDDWHNNYEGAPTDGSAWFDDNKNLAEKMGGAVLRGGSWLVVPTICRSAFRGGIDRREFRNFDDGFRVVCVSGRTL